MTKYRYRYVFTVTRRYDEKKPLREITNEFSDVQSDEKFFLYSDRAKHEKIDVRLEVWDKPNKRWLPVATKKKTEIIYGKQQTRSDPDSGQRQCSNGRDRSVSAQRMRRARREKSSTRTQRFRHGRANKSQIVPSEVDAPRSVPTC